MFILFSKISKITEIPNFVEKTGHENILILVS